MRAIAWFVVLVLWLALSVPAAPGQTRPAVDGKIGANEYVKSSKLDRSGATLYWSVVGDTLQIAIRAESDGWVGIGFLTAKTQRKLGADQYIFTLEGGKPAALDLYQAIAIGGPVADTDRGGKNSILTSAVTRQGKNWIVEFTRKLKTGESTDIELVPGKKIVLLFALGGDMNWKKPHQATRRWEIPDFVF